jgi:hypothetical protein
MTKRLLPWERKDYPGFSIDWPPGFVSSYVPSKQVTQAQKESRKLNLNKGLRRMNQSVKAAGIGIHKEQK